MEQFIFKNKNCGIHKPVQDPRLFSINKLDKNCKNHLVSYCGHITKMLV